MDFDHLNPSVKWPQPKLSQHQMCENVELKPSNVADSFANVESIVVYFEVNKNNIDQLTKRMKIIVNWKHVIREGLIRNLVRK